MFQKQKSLHFTSKLSLLGLCFGFFMVMMDVTIVNVSVPSIGHQLNASLSSLQWIVNGYTLSFSCLLLSAGNLSDRFNTKKIFCIGLLGFVISSLGCGFARNTLLLICFRVLQGVFAALLVPTSLTLINRLYSNRADRAKAIGIWGALGGIAAASGPILGGLLTNFLGWPAIFYINVPIGLLGLWLTFRYVQFIRPKQTQGRKLDIFGQIVATTGIAVITFVLIEVGEIGWENPLILTGCIVFILAILLFLRIESISSHPMVPLDLFLSPNFSCSIFIGMILNIGFYGQLFILPIYFQEVRGYSALMTALAILPQPGLAAIASYLSGKLTSKIGPYKPTTIGLLVGALGFLLLSYLDDIRFSYVYIIVPLMAVGFGTAFTMPAVTVATINAVPNQRAGLASGTLNMSRQIGSLLGVALFGSIINRSNYFILNLFILNLRITLIISFFLFLCGILLNFLVRRLTYKGVLS